MSNVTPHKLPHHDVPKWRLEGWLPAGPGKCRCPKCDTVTSTNAKVRRKHKCPKKNG